MRRPRSWGVGKRMSKRKRRKVAKVEAKQAGPSNEQDPRAIEALTVGWMLSLMACLASEFGAIVGFVVVAIAGGADQMPGLWALAPFVLALIALVTGTCCLVLTVVAGRIRRTPAPRLIVRVAWTAGLLPWIALMGLIFANAAQ